MNENKLRKLESQLRRIGCNFRFWGRAEIKELANVLLPGETVEHCVNGSYEGGFALLAATDQRVLLIDKKPFYLTLEDIRFDMISEIDYNHRMMNATVFICTPNKSMRFLGYNHDRLRKLFNFVQTKVMEIRQHYAQQTIQQPQQPVDQSMAQGFAPYLAMAAAQSAQAYLQDQYRNSSQQLPPLSAQPITTPQPRRVAPIISAYTRLPIMSRQHRQRLLGSRAISNTLS